VTIVVDTNVLVSALLRPSGPPGAVLDLVLARRVRLALDDRIFAEYAEVLSRPEFEFPGLGVASLLEYLWRSAERVRAPALPVVLPDRDDVMFVEVGVAALAQALVTGNLRHFPPAQRWGLRVLTPRDAVALALGSA
jgi:putative PIN family toxin of toxin-antitoxin system